MGRGTAHRWTLAAGLILVISSCGRADDGADVAGTEQTAPTVAAVASTTTPPPPPATTQVAYVVQSGDSLSVIAGRFGVSTKALADFNAITDVNSIVVGQELSIPPTTAPPAETSSTTTSG